MQALRLPGLQGRDLRQLHLHRRDGDRPCFSPVLRQQRLVTSTIAARRWLNARFSSSGTPTISRTSRLPSLRAFPANRTPEPRPTRWPRPASCTSRWRRPPPSAAPARPATATPRRRPAPCWPARDACADPGHPRADVRWSYAVATRPRVSICATPPAPVRVNATSRSNQSSVSRHASAVRRLDLLADLVTADRPQRGDRLHRGEHQVVAGDRLPVTGQRARR